MEQSMKKTGGEVKGSSSAETSQNVRQRVPLRMFGKRFCSKRLLVSSKVLMHTIPTHDCDIVLMLPARTQDSTLMWLLARLRSRTPQLLVHVRHHSNSGIYGLYMTAKYESLLCGAEELGISKPVRSEYGGGMKEFVFEDQDCFEGVLEEKLFLNSQERQSIVYHMLNNLRATEGEEVEGIKFLQGEPIIPKLVSRRVVSGVFPLHCRPDLIDLRMSWVHAFVQKQPLDDICHYFGVKIGLYFAFLGHYTLWLLLPSVMGICMWMLRFLDQWWEDVSWVLFGIFNIFWATVYLVHWRRTSAALAYRWGTFDKKDDLLKDPRPLYKGDLQKSPVTGNMEPVYPDWKRNVFRYFVSMPIIIFFQLFVLAIMLLTFKLDEWLNALAAQGDIPSFLGFMPKVLLCLFLTVLDDVYRQVAVWLNNKENYRLQETHDNNLILKLLLVQFVSSFLPLFYIAFYLRDMNRLRDQLAALLITRQILGNFSEALVPYVMWKSRLYKAMTFTEYIYTVSTYENLFITWTNQLGYKMTARMSPSTLDREVEKVAQEYRRRLVRPWEWNTAKEKRKDNSEHQKPAIDRYRAHRKDSKKGIEKVGEEEEEKETKEVEGHLTQAEAESTMPVYDDTYTDYLEMAIQFGHVIIFSTAFPLAALCSLLNNIVEIRSDAFKLCYTHQRPFGVRVENIGIWQDVLEAMVLVAVIVNAALIGMAGVMERLVPGLSDVSMVLLLVSIEHIILGIKFALSFAIPHVPQWVATEMAKVEFQRRQSLKQMESPGTSNNTFDVRERPPRTRSKESESSDYASPRSPDSITPPPRRSPSASSSSSSSSLSSSSPASPPSFSQARNQSLVGHRPQNFANSQPEDRLRSRTLLSGLSGPQNPWREESETNSGPASPSCPYKDFPHSPKAPGSTDADRAPERGVAVYKNFWEPDRQIYRRTNSGMSRTNSGMSCRIIVRQDSAERNAGVAHSPSATSSATSSFTSKEEVLISKRSVSSLSDTAPPAPRGAVPPPPVDTMLPPCIDTVPSPPRDTMASLIKDIVSSHLQTASFRSKGSMQDKDDKSVGTKLLLVSSSLGESSVDDNLTQHGKSSSHV